MGVLGGRHIGRKKSKTFEKKYNMFRTNPKDFSKRNRRKKNPE